MSKYDSGRQLRLQRLRVGVKLMVVIAFAAMFWVMVSSSSSTAPASRALPELEVAIDDLSAGQSRRVLWAERPIIILHRTEAQIAALNPDDERLRDPTSSASLQPNFALNAGRSYSVEWFVAIALGTDLNCIVEILPATDGLILGESWHGGFRDTCRGSYYDLAGRVYKGQYAGENLEVPNYTISGDSLFLGRAKAQ